MIEAFASEQPPARMVAGALAHLATHMETGCPRAAYLAAMLLERIATDEDADAHLRTHARELVAILERDESPRAEREATPAAAWPAAPAPAGGELGASR